MNNDKTLIQAFAPTIKVVVVATLAIAVVGSTALFVERFSRLADGTHDLSI